MESASYGVYSAVRQDGNANFIPIDKDLFNPLSMFHCRTHTWNGDERERRQDGNKRETRREETGC